ncbi:M56 family metallopeptidase [Rhodococcus maanshanensis]|uniref:Zn-dependent protease with chaperone function n=1 Tax=Rhodococcus maanshanensis TaxID=183556 RepID=A0A1H7FG79_9NOCA|nr:M56 family metallopeptidase [Rhodococcus maanshanensis]SEK25173.1 Zn-dependent protease with chaperone function [Rhodococcus maanshanensis]
MGMGAFLLLYSVLIAVFAPSLLIRLTHRGNAPRLGVAAWTTAIAGALASWITGAALLAVELSHAIPASGAGVVGSCLRWLRELAGDGVAVGVQIGLLASASAAAAVVGWRLVRGLITTRRRTHAHARDARLVARRVRGVDALVLDAGERAAYCVPGRPSVIIVTSSALEALGAHELDAVLAHERAHLNGHHPQLVAVLRVLAETLPRVALFSAGAAEVSRLLEMCADDAATRIHGRSALLAGLIALAGSGPAPAEGMGATSVAVLDRAGRLAASLPAPDRGRARARLAAASVLLALVPALMAGAGAMWCPPVVL